MSTPPPPGTLKELRRAARERAKAEAHEWAVMVAFRDNALARLRRDATPMRQLVERQAISLQIARETLMSEAQVLSRLACADRTIEHAPRTWEAFGRGWVDAARVQVIARALEKLERDDSRQRFDVEALAYARTHTVAELRRWAERFVARVEADLWAARAEAERAKRFVRVEHLDDGMALLQAYLPSHHAAAIEDRLNSLAKAHRCDVVDEDGSPITVKRTLAELRADVLTHLLTSAPVDHVPGTPGLRCDIAVTIDAGVLTGAVSGPTQSADGSWQVPTDWVLGSAWAGEAFWHRLLTDPITRNTLAHDYRGYSPPELLRQAIQFRDQVCATPGCLVPADRCELDHRIPWPRGRTRGDNLDPRCKRDHARKGHGVALELLTASPPLREHVLNIEFMHAA
ncbi:HNH endonuclease signature motif containing protein [Aeromicrobium alkaliterrae]|uniref:HNH nuclease domain-containing protein n=1 Tax=Aeromicrobium alkaliterrae TaxID=302168 RepID=A0ABP4VPC3_9ACTN